MAVSRSDLLMEQSRFYRRRGKRLFDITVVLAASVLGAPLALSIALMVRAVLGRPVLFRQERTGFRGRSFALVKFRTMRVQSAAGGVRESDQERLGRLGRALRASSLDELPEFWNVLRGDMSIVGPRPLLAEYLPLYSPQQSRRHEVYPGITGWAQVNGRNALTWEEKFELDVWYVENVSFALDVRILWKTLLSVVRREGISAAGEATMPRFRGSAA